MIRCAPLLLCLGLIGCGAQPAPEFFGATRQEIPDGAQRYVLFRKAHRFEIIRLGGYVPLGAPQATIRARMLELVETTTSCRVIADSVKGDAGEMRGSLRCG